MESDAMIDLRLKTARSAFDQKDFLSALIEAEELLDHHPDHLLGLMIVGDSSLELGEAMGAEAAFTRVLEFQPESTAALSGLAISRFELTNFEGAIDSATQAISLKATHAEAFYIRGLAHEFAGRADEAEGDFQTAQVMAPEHYPLPKVPDSESWPEIVEAAKSLLDEEIQEWIDGIELRVIPIPAAERLRESTPPLSPSSLALFFGELPKTDQDPWVTKPERIELYARNLARAAIRDGDIVGPVREGLRREASEWLGLNR